jgi:hypothetical protein
MKLGHTSFFRAIKKSLAVFLLLLLLSEATQAQKGAVNRFLTPAPKVNDARVVIVAGSWGLVYSVSLVELSRLWYKKYPHSKFHFFNDNKEWNQMDKMGHVFTAYFESNFTNIALQWAGLNNKTASLIGFATGEGFQLTLEVLDGHSAEWGFSPGDATANTIGAGIFLAQQLGWDEQRIQLKFSYFPTRYADEDESRADDLYGRSIFSRLIKDYNSQTYWYSINPYSFIKNSEPNFPQWFNVSVGYSAGNMLGANRNSWKMPDGSIMDRTDLPRFRKFYLSVDADLTRIKVNDQTFHTVLTMANLLKVPAPALEFNTKGKLIFHPIYY